MITRTEYRDARERMLKYLKRAGIVVTPQEADRVEVADFGLSDLKRLGLFLITYVNTERVCSKELVLLPRQTCPEHRHPPLPQFGDPGKEETFRCRRGSVYLYVEGPPTPPPLCAKLPEGERGKHFTVFHEVVLRPGEQFTIPPDTLHWFQAGDEGAVVSEFSTRSRDEFDIFTDPEVKRAPQVADE